ncbi:MAG: hypothetical protein ACU0GG_20830 [Paracoccaceae bacterium]
MIWTILLGAAAGWGAGAVEDQLRPYIAQYLPGEAPGPAEMRAVALALCLLGAALVAMLTGGGGAIALTLGAALGVLGPRLLAKGKAMRAPDYDS